MTLGYRWGVLRFAMPHGYGHLKDAHVVVLEQHPV